MKKIIGALLVVSSITGCSTNSYYADRINTNESYSTPKNVVAVMYNLGKYSAYSVPKESRKEHENCVYMMLDNGNPGDSCNWNSDNAFGTVRVAMIRPNLCHELTSTVTYKQKTTSWNDTACLSKDNKWIFYAQ